MPLDEEGAKWSCEPCIRGHRSSKCQHFDRLMMKVPKAGRPLAKCPHPKGTCSCQKLYAFMVRIPKGSTCLCRPLYQVPVSMNESAQTTTPPAIAPMSSSASGKIQKSTKRQTHLHATPENIAKALNSMSEFDKSQAENGTSHHLPSYPPHTQGFSNSPSAINSGFNTPTAIVPHQSFGIGESSTSQSSCCQSRKPQPTTPVPAQGSCCKKPKSPTGNSPSVESTLDGQIHSYPSSHSHTGYTPLSAPQMASWQDFDAADRNNFIPPYTLQANHMSHATPEPSELGFTHENVSRSIGFSQTNHTQDFSYTTPATLDSDATHECNCGDDCQCLGCASHPFNNTTRQHVQEMGLLVTLDGGEQSLANLSGYHNPSLHDKPGATPLEYHYTNFSYHLGNGSQPMGIQSYPENNQHSNNMSNGYSSPPAEFASEQHLMVPSEYYTLEYPVGLPTACSDVTGSCRCGSDCSCVGCLTHSGHNGLPLEPLTVNNNTLDHMGPPHSSAEQAGIRSSRIPILDNLPVHSPNPML